MTRPVEATQGRSGTDQKQAQPVYVYGVIPAADAARWPQPPGLDGPAGTVRIVVDGGLAALVSTLPPDHTPGRRADIEAHRRVLSLAIERGTTIPMRFGMVMDGDEVVRERLLERHNGELRELMDRLDGHVQMLVKAFYAEDALLADVLAANPDLAQASAALSDQPPEVSQAARVRLGERVANAVERRRADVEAALLDRLATVVEQIQVDSATSERVALSAQVLVHRHQRAALDETVRWLSEALDGVLAFRYVGPLPPYSFADLALDDDQDAR
jgi:hypothetical protein